uniref:Uncharacterized protein n=1 Tax=Pavo cristatus TaxID=9049 RepID=A0A8C9EYE2_PAVCR
MKDIKSTTQKKYTDYSKSPGSPDNDFLFMYSVMEWCVCSLLVYVAEVQKMESILSAAYLVCFFI